MKKSLFSACVVGLGLTVNLWAQVPYYVPTNGLVGYWPFNGNANDESGNGNNGTVNGATLTADRFGNANKAYNFDGNDWIEVNNNPNQNVGAGSFTLSCWSLKNGSNNFDHLITRNLATSNQDFISSYTLRYQSGTIAVAGSSSAQANLNNSGCSTPQLNNLYNWNFIVAVFNSASANYRIFQNGVLISNCSINQNFYSFNNNGKIYFGAENPVANLVSGPLFLSGNMDDIGIWSRALSECEIQDLYNTQINSVAGSIAVSPISASLGSNVTLSTASSSNNVQWQSNPLNYGWQNIPANSTYSGINTNTLVVNNIQLANHNQPFRVIASSGSCTDTSNIATIQIADTCITNLTVYDTLLTTVTDTLIINTTLSLPAPNNENTILIYPNPASDHITIDNGNFAAMAGYTIKIENNAGQQVFQSAINQAQFYVYLSTWTGNGLYFVHLIDPQNNTVTVRKIVLQ